MNAGPSVNSFVERSAIRRSLLSLLVGSSRTPSELAMLEKKHVSHVSRALAELRSRGLVEYTESGSRERYYTATSQGYAAVVAMLHSTH